MRSRLSIAVVVLLVARGALAVDPDAVKEQQRVAAQKRAIAAIEILGGRVDEKREEPGEQLLMVYLDDSRVTDADLAGLRKLANLRNLSLGRTAITDAGLVHLQELTGLQKLSLEHTGVSDAGLAHLKSLTELESLNLGLTKVSDAGLVHLKGLTRLQVLHLWGSKVTDAGVNELQKALPDCRITREVRVWTDVNDVQLEASFVRLVGNQVTLRKEADGAELTLPLEDLSQADQQIVRQMAAATRDKK